MQPRLCAQSPNSQKQSSAVNDCTAEICYKDGGLQKLKHVLTIQYWAFWPEKSSMSLGLTGTWIGNFQILQDSKTQCRLLPKIARALSQLIRHNGRSYIRWTKLTIAKIELRNQCLKLPNSCSTKTEEWPSPSKSCEGGVWSLVQAGSFRDEAEIISGLQRRCRVESAGDCLEPRWMDKGRCGQERLPGLIEPFRILSQRLRLYSSFLYGEAVHRTQKQSE